MSADNWTICPKCNKEEVDSIADFEQEIRDSYGKVSEGEYNRLKHNLERLMQQRVEPTLREDYEIGMDSNKFYVSYRCSCSECDFSYTYKYSDTIT